MPHAHLALIPVSLGFQCECPSAAFTLFEKVSLILKSTIKSKSGNQHAINRTTTNRTVRRGEVPSPVSCDLSYVQKYLWIIANPPIKIRVIRVVAIIRHSDNPPENPLILKIPIQTIDRILTPQSSKTFDF